VSGHGAGFTQGGYALTSGVERALRTLLVDNYDSFTYNLYQLIAQVNGVEPTVVKNDDPYWASIDLEQFDAAVISPGPGHPSVKADVGHSLDLLRNAVIPTLGVCLGHQLIAHFHGAPIEHPHNGVMHGRLSEIFHDGDDSGLLAGIPSPFNAVRYHSFVAAQLPPELEGIAYTSDGVLMALRHVNQPIWGVQFHPESICTDYGVQLTSNFRDLAEKWAAENGRQLRRFSLPADKADSVAAPPMPTTRKVAWRRLDTWVDPALVFEALYGNSNPAFWLDSAGSMPGTGRFSFMGDATGPDAELLTYDTETKEITITANGVESLSIRSIFDYLEQRLAERAVAVSDLPFDFELGYVGYLGYELKNECGASARHSSPQPDAGLIFADRMIAFDHDDRVIYLVALDGDEAEHRFDEAEAVLGNIHNEEWPAVVTSADDNAPVVVSLRHDEQRYKELIKACHHEIHEGESYEVCLTNMIHAQPLPNPLATYLALRRSNPASFAAYLRFSDFAVLSSSPERFLRVDGDGCIEARPIKGTVRRGADAVEDQKMKAELRTEKYQAENLMIVDLLRNDLGAVSEVGSVKVPKLFDVETLPTVHQLVSTITAQLRSDRSAVACVKAAFPGGSMTGAPKHRTLDIIDRLEGGHRGIYSGAIGYFSLNGATDWSIVIRTIIATARETTIGIGGAITALSDPQAEFDETMLKAQALLDAISKVLEAPRSRD
jgi:para-aminobenzoate synthetase